MKMSKRIDKHHNQTVRARVNGFMNHYGTTNKFFADKAGMNVSNFNMFALGHRDLSEYSLEKIERFLDSASGVNF